MDNDFLLAKLVRRSCKNSSRRVRFFKRGSIIPILVFMFKHYKDCYCYFGEKDNSYNFNLKFYKHEY